MSDPSTERVISARAHYGRVPESLLFSDATDAECRLYATLTTYDYRAAGECYPGREVVAAKLGWSVRTLDRHFNALAERGALERRRQGRGHPNLIVLLADVDDSPDMAGHPMSRQIGAHESPDHDIASSSRTKKNEPAADCRTVFDAWVESTNRTARTQLDAKRRRLITNALKSYPLEDVLDAVTGWECSPYHRGKNTQRTVYNDLGLLLRDAEHIEKFRDLRRGSGFDPKGLNAHLA